MSADNVLTINRKTFEVRDCWSEDISKGSLVGKGKSLEEAITIAQDYVRENIVEYGIIFVGESS